MGEDSKRKDCKFTFYYTELGSLWNTEIEIVVRENVFVARIQEKGVD